MISFYQHIIDVLKQLMLPCLFKLIFHRDCPGCGFQRSVLLLLRGEFSKSFHLYWATLPILFLFCFCILHLKFGIKHGARILIFLYISIGVLILSHYIYKLSMHL
ncbi:MAG: DUF2752 domain-containing protein [Flavisolibacter sp.]|nr:DUF2752 domain-containing protein [Flavisolibacter sp.]